MKRKPLHKRTTTSTTTKAATGTNERNPLRPRQTPIGSDAVVYVDVAAVVKDYNSGKLTDQQVAKKHNLSTVQLFTVLDWSEA
jgi:hypothetical protein